MPPSARLDLVLAKLGLCPSREKAKAAVAAGLVYVNGKACTKPSCVVTPSDHLEVRGSAIPYVGRGGLKLKKALDVWNIDLSGLRCVDAGASTGGFTDCMLRAGADHVHAIDVGHDQLDPTLAQDARVTNMEGTDIRGVDARDIGGGADFLGTDVSFIGLSKVLPALAGLLHDGGRAVCLVKPQFEAGPEHVGKKGIVKDPCVHRQVLGQVAASAQEAGFDVLGLDHSPVTGGDGNVEFLIYLVKRPHDAAGVLDEESLGALMEATVARAHAEFE